MRNIILIILFLYAQSSLSGTLVAEDLARLILQDSRLTQFTSAMQSAYQAQCPLPAADHLEADISCGPGGDQSSCYYTFSTVCTGSPDLSLILFRTEFVTPNPLPMNFQATAVFNR